MTESKNQKISAGLEETKGSQMKTVHQVSQLSGVSIRTLHYYDEIGLLIPTVTTDAGYRLYDMESLERLQDIMLFRELEFPLKDIKKILENPEFDREKALEDQIKLLELKRAHLTGLIKLAKKLKVKGETEMSFKEFDQSKIEEYRAEAKERWGDTAAYKEFEEKDKVKSADDKKAEANAMMSIFTEFGTMKDKDPADETAQAQVKKLQDFITDKYYNCTNEILAGLGAMYASGNDFTKNIDKAGGEETAVFVSKAIEIYCK